MGYTSGTTGHPKAVERPAPRPARDVATTSTVAAFWGYGPDTVQLVCGPLYHTAPSAYAEYALWEGGRRWFRTASSPSAAWTSSSVIG